MIMSGVIHGILFICFQYLAHVSSNSPHTDLVTIQPAHLFTTRFQVLHCLLQEDMNVGSVCDLRQVKEAIATARAVMDHTSHTTLSGLQATAFALQMGLKLTNLSTPASSNAYYTWWASAPSAMHSERVAMHSLLVPADTS